MLKNSLVGGELKYKVNKVSKGLIKCLSVVILHSREQSGIKCFTLIIFNTNYRKITTE